MANNRLAQQDQWVGKGRGLATFDSLMDAMDGQAVKPIRLADGSIQVGAFRLSDLQLEVSGQPTFDEYIALGIVLKHIESNMQWWLGDWLVAAEKQYGETYAQLVDMTSLREQTLYNYHYVASRIEFYRRRENLSWSHHAAVASKSESEQERLLNQAVENGWPASALRRVANGDEPFPPTLSRSERLNARYDEWYADFAGAGQAERQLMYLRLQALIARVREDFGING